MRRRRSRLRPAPTTTADKAPTQTVVRRRARLPDAGRTLRACPSCMLPPTVTSPSRWNTAFADPIAQVISSGATIALLASVTVPAASASSNTSNPSTACLRHRPASRPTVAPIITPATNTAINAPANRLPGTLLSMPTAIRVELPLMNDTNRPPSFRKPSASTKPASAARPIASRWWWFSYRRIAYHRTGRGEGESRSPPPTSRHFDRKPSMSAIDRSEPVGSVIEHE